GAMSLLTTTSERRYTLRDVGPAEDIARLVAVALENARLHREARWEANRTALLQKVTEALARAASSDRIVDVIVRQGLEALGASGGLIALVDAEGQGLTLAGTTGNPAALFLGKQHVSHDERLPSVDAARGNEVVWLETREAWEQRYPKLAPGQGAGVALP